MNRKFKVGDVVCLNSSKHIPMTISVLLENDKYKCTWFDRTGVKRKLQENIFIEGVLTKYINPAGARKLS